MLRHELIVAVHATETAAVLAVTGGGASLIGQLLAVPGASRTVLEAVVPYSSAALESWVGEPVAGAVSARSAQLMAAAALARAEALHAAEPPVPLVGLGVTAALASDRPKRGDHRAHIATLARPAGAGHTTAATASAWALTLDKGRRTRAEEDQVVADVALAALARACGLPGRLDWGLGPGDALVHPAGEVG